MEMAGDPDACVSLIHKNPSPAPRIKFFVYTYRIYMFPNTKDW